MGNLVTTTKNSLVPKKATFSNFMIGDAVKKKVNEMIGGKDGQRFISAVISAVSVNPALAGCDHSSILSAALLGESLKLSPSPQLGYYYMVPYNDKKRGCTVAQFQIGYKGYLQLAMRSGFYKKINVIALKEGELRSFDALNEEIDAVIIDDEAARERAKTIGYYAMFEYTNGFRKAIYWSYEKMLKHADTYSQAFHAEAYKKLLAGEISKNDMWKYSSFWYKNFDDMALKTMLRQLLGKWGILSVDLEKAYSSDDAVINTDMQPEYIESVETAEDASSENLEQKALEYGDDDQEQDAEEHDCGMCADNEDPFA